MGSWLAGAYSDSFREEVLSSTSTCSGLLDINYGRQLFERHRRGQVDHSFLLWAIWLLERWSMLGQATWHREREAAAMMEVSPVEAPPSVEPVRAIPVRGTSGIRWPHPPRHAGGGAEVLVYEIIRRLGNRIQPVIFVSMR
jgi:hypothetical protein